LELVKQKLRKRFCLRKDWEDECKDVREAERRNQALRDSRQADLVAMGDVPKPRKIDEVALQGLVRAASDAVKALHTAVSLTEECLVTKTTKITRHKTAKAAVAKYSEEAAALTATQEDADEARDKLAQHRAAELEVHAKEALLETYDEQLETRQHELDRLERILERSENARHWVSVLQGARDVLHRGNLPRIVHHNALTRMESGINEILDQFEQPWYVTTADDLSYVAHFRNGTVMPASGLSGGQQVLLALAFRWVLNSLFASQIGMMVLDEPTAGLDERHLDLLEIALQKLGEQARSVGYQVIIITHQLTLERVIDQSIKLDRIIG
jgi:exonuclease SbcC